MRNAWSLFLGDIKRLTSNVVTVIIVLGLVFIPSIFSWYNILACWDVFGNTGRLTVAVANADEGYESDLMPLRVNIGERVVSALRENDQLDWTFTSEDDAIDGVRSGEYYAAVVIPPSFSKDMMTFYSNEVEHAQIVYYANEKKSAVAPKVTDQGADQVSYQVNKVFTETLAEIALGVSSSLSRYADDADLSGGLGDLAGRVDKMGTQMSQAASVLKTYSSIVEASQGLVSGSASLLSQAKGSADQVVAAAGEGRQAVSTIAEAMAASADALAEALQKSSAGYAGVADSIDAAFATTGTLATDSAAKLRSQAASIDAQITDNRTLVAQLEQLEGQVPSEYKPTIEALVQQLNSSIELQESLRDGMGNAADSIESGNSDAQSQHAEVKKLATDAQQSMAELAEEYETDIKPSLELLSSEMATMVDSLNCSAQQLGTVADNLVGAADPIVSSLDGVKQKLNSTADSLVESAGKLQSLSQSMLQALSSGDVQLLRQVLESDPTTLATALAAPVGLDKHAVFPADNFGSQMAPLYTTLALWIGTLLLVVAIKVNVSDAAQEGLRNPRLHQLFFGRFGVFAVLSLLQSTCMALGNLLFLGVQAVNPLLYLVCFWVSGLVFTFFIYSMVVAFANLGKAIGVLLLIVQVTGGGGSFPLQLLPSFFQAISPYLPATHVINAMRAAMMGVYQNDFWIEMGLLLLFLVPAALVGLVLRKPLMKFLDWYVGKVEDSKLVS